MHLGLLHLWQLRAKKAKNRNEKHAKRKKENGAVESYTGGTWSYCTWGNANQRKETKEMKCMHLGLLHMGGSMHLGLLHLGEFKKERGENNRYTQGNCTWGNSNQRKLRE
jgi:surface antigen